MVVASSSQPPSPMATTTTSTPWPPKLRLLQSQLSSEERRRIPSQMLMKILGQHSNGLLPMQMGKGNEYWLNSYVDFDEVFLMGDSARPNTSGTDDPLINPVVEYSKLRSLGCNRLMVVLPAKDILKHRGRYYAEKLEESWWKGEAEVYEIKGVDHGFYLANATTKSAVEVLKRTVSFIVNHQWGLIS